MGMFDTVHIKCPHCGEIHSEQTKSGPRALIEASLDNADPDMISGLHDDDGNICCEHCAGSFRVEMVNRPTYRAVKAMQHRDCKHPSTTDSAEESPKFLSDIEIAARALNMKLHGATELGQRTQWIEEALMVERYRNVQALEPCMKCGRNRSR